MGKYWIFWRRGWWAWLFMLCFNVTAALLFLPVAFLTDASGPAYWLGGLAVALFIVIPIVGWFFEVFAANSSRLVSQSPCVNLYGANCTCIDITCLPSGASDASAIDGIVMSR